MTKFIRPASESVAPPNPSVNHARDVDDEIREWKKARGSHFPFRLLALVASASFGIASVALPAAVNDWAQYPLYALSAAGLYAAFRKSKH